MGASRTLLNKQGRRPGIVAFARAKFPLNQQRRQYTPRGTVSIRTVDRVKSAIIAVVTHNAEQRA